MTSAELQLKLRRIALETIEGLCLVYDDDKSQDFAGDVYKFAHVGLGGCEHPTWVTELLQAHSDLKDSGVI